VYGSGGENPFVVVDGRFFVRELNDPFPFLSVFRRSFRSDSTKNYSQS
jgi:hypothetical protein